MSEELAFAGALELRSLIASKQVSPVEVAETYLSRIERLDPQLNSYLTVTVDEALRAAQAAEDAVTRGDSLGPLHGVPVSIKDSEDTAGVRYDHGGALPQEPRARRGLAAGGAHPRRGRRHAGQDEPA